MINAPRHRRCGAGMSLVFMAFVVATTLGLGDLTRRESPGACTLQSELMGSLYAALGVVYYALYRLARALVTAALGGGGEGIRAPGRVPTKELDPVAYEDVTCFVIQEEGEQEEEEQAVGPAEGAGEQRPESFSVRKVWTNVYGLGVVGFLAMVKLQHDRILATGVLCVALGSAGAWEEGRRGSWACGRGVWLFVCCVSALGACALSSADEILQAAPGAYEAGVLGIAVPLAIVALLKVVRKPDNVYETLEVSLPCTGMLALMVLVLTLLYERSCFKDMVLVAVEADDEETVMVVDGRLVLGGLLNPMPCTLTVAVLVGAVLDKRSLDACCVLMACASVRAWAGGGHWPERPLLSAGCVASATSVVALLLYRWDRRGWLRYRETAMRRLSMLRGMRDARTRAAARGPRD